MDDFLHEIMDRKTSGEKLSSEEEALLTHWLSNSDHRREYKELFELKRLLLAREICRKEVSGQGFDRFRKEIRRDLSRRWQFVGYAAAIMLAGMLTWIVLRQPILPSGGVGEQVAMAPLNKQVVIKMASGECIALEDNSRGIVRKEAGVTIEQTEKGTLQYNTQNDVVGKVENNTLLVPRGGKYTLVLADGTKIWLNAATSLTYPVCFTSATREVTLEGEAYFEVAKDKNKPFIVKTAGLNTCVTGTQFNVSAYSGRCEVTLIEGGVDVSIAGQTPEHLNVNEQAVLRDGKIQMREADTDAVTAWKNGRFLFKKRRLEQIIEELSRWYDLDVTYLDMSVKDYHFSAQFKREDKIEDVIVLLEKTEKIKIIRQENSLFIDKK